MEVEGKPLEVKYNKFEYGQRGKFDTLFVEVRYGSDERIIKIEGGAGWIEPPVTFKIDNIEIGLAWGSKYVSLPFSLRLDKFNLERYAGSNTPSSFASDVHVSDLSNNPINHRISMNQPLTYKGYKIFQSSYDKDEQGTMFEINKDPGKIPTYIGYFLLCVGFIANFFTKGSRFLYLCRFLNKTTLSLLFLVLLSFPQLSEAEEIGRASCRERVPSPV